MNAPAISQPVRTRLARITRSVHDDLHQDPLLSKLPAQDITLQEFQLALQVFLSFYGAVECLRLRWSLWPELTLRKTCAALQEDTNAPKLICTLPSISSGAGLLGVLYVAHGATFGRQSFRTNITNSLPEAPLKFLSLQPDKTCWSYLVDRLEDQGSTEPGFREIAHGSMGTFLTMQRISARARLNAQLEPKNSNNS